MSLLLPNTRLLVAPPLPAAPVQANVGTAAMPTGTAPCTVAGRTTMGPSRQVRAPSATRRCAPTMALAPAARSSGVTVNDTNRGKLPSVGNTAPDSRPADAMLSQLPASELTALAELLMVRDVATVVERTQEVLTAAVGNDDAVAALATAKGARSPAAALALLADVAGVARIGGGERAERTDRAVLANAGNIIGCYAAVVDALDGEPELPLLEALARGSAGLGSLGRGEAAELAAGIVAFAADQDADPTLWTAQLEALLRLHADSLRQSSEVLCTELASNDALVSEFVDTSTKLGRRDFGYLSAVVHHLRVRGSRAEIRAVLQRSFAAVHGDAPTFMLLTLGQSMRLDHARIDEPLAHDASPIATLSRQLGRVERFVAAVRRRREPTPTESTAPIAVERRILAAFSVQEMAGASEQLFGALLALLFKHTLPARPAALRRFRRTLGRARCRLGRPEAASSAQWLSAIAGADPRLAV